MHARAVIGVFRGRVFHSQASEVRAGTIIEVNCADLGLVTPSGKVVWGKYAQVGLLTPLPYGSCLITGQVVGCSWSVCASRLRDDELQLGHREPWRVAPVLRNNS
eukprot:scaffold180734_cov35-Tisochrysis_lutea.AAC.3